MNKITIKDYYELSEEVLNDIEVLENSIFDEPYSIDSIKKSLERKFSPVILIAYIDNNTPCGYKIGHEMSEGLFYSWIGGVNPLYRKKGIASLLMDKQHEVIKKMGFKTVRTGSENKFKNMLILNLKKGFDIIGTYYSVDNLDLNIMFEKKL